MQKQIIIPNRSAIRTGAFGLALLVSWIPFVCPGDEPAVIKVDVILQADHVGLAPAGDPPTFSAVTIPRVINPKSGKPFDRSTDVPGCALADLRRTFRLAASEVLLGEPVLVEFRIELDGPGRWDEPVGGNSRGLGRDGRFFFLMRHEDGSWVPDIFEGHNLSSFGGLGGFARVERGRPYSNWNAVQQWCAIDRPGDYDLYAFHAGGETRPAGLRQRVEAALSEKARARVSVDEEGRLIDRETRKRSREFFVEQSWNYSGKSRGSPLAGSIPLVVKEKLKGNPNANDYAHFRLTIRRGDARQRREMVERWTRKPADDDGIGAERAGAASRAMALARQDDFLPELERRLRARDGFSPDPVLLGLAMRDNPRALDLLFETGSAEAIEMFRFLQPARVPAAIPRLIDRLTDPDHVTRAASEEMLRRWTGQGFNHTWEGYDSMRPTLAEGRAMQPLYRSWWERNREGFQPKFR